MTQSATTIWEHWDGWTHEKGFQDVGMNSCNHYADGAVGDWMVSTVAGLQFAPAQSGYRPILFKPRPGGTLTWAEARLQTPHGETSVRWELEEAQRALNLVVPDGATATLSPPKDWNHARKVLPDGRHRIVMDAQPQPTAKI